MFKICDQRFSGAHCSRSLTLTVQSWSLGLAGIICVLTFLSTIPAVGAPHAFELQKQEPTILEVNADEDDDNSDYEFVRTRSLCTATHFKKDPDKERYLRELSKKIRDGWEDKGTPDDLAAVLIRIKNGKVELLPQFFLKITAPYFSYDVPVSASRNASRAIRKIIDHPARRSNINSVLAKLPSAPELLESTFVQETLPHLMQNRKLALELIENALPLAGTPPDNLEVVVRFDYYDLRASTAVCGRGYSTDSHGRIIKKIPPPPIGLSPSYVRLLTQKITSNWQIPSNSHARKRAKAIFKVAKTGAIADLHLEKSSGDSEFDEWALKAVRSSSPFRPLPPYPPEFAEIELAFDFDERIAPAKQKEIFQVQVDMPDAVASTTCEEAVEFSSEITRLNLNDRAGKQKNAEKAPFDVNHIDWDPYMERLQKRISRLWNCNRSEQKTVVTFKVRECGEISDLSVESSSGDSLCDTAALQAVQDAAPFHNLPDGVPTTPIQFSFQGAGPGIQRKFILLNF